MDFVENKLAIPVIKGEKTETERFPGAVTTYCFEAMMQDGKALQGGTSHFLGQNFAKASKIMFQDQNGEQAYAWTTSWGVTTRLIGGLIMVHGDDDGLVLPPRIAPLQIVIIPLIHNDETKDEVISYCQKLKEKLQKISYEGKNLQVQVDARDTRSGEKVWSWIKKGVPIRIEIGPRELAENRLSVTKRTKPHKEKELQSEKEFTATVIKQLDEMQNDLFLKAKAFRDNRCVKIDTKEEFYQFFEEKKDHIQGGFALAHWSGESSVEEVIKNDLNVTIRCIPIDGKKEEGLCPFTGKKSKQRVIFAKSY